MESVGRRSQRDYTLAFKLNQHPHLLKDGPKKVIASRPKEVWSGYHLHSHQEAAQMIKESIHIYNHDDPI